MCWKPGFRHYSLTKSYNKICFSGYSMCCVCVKGRGGRCRWGCLVQQSPELWQGCSLLQDIWLIAGAPGPIEQGLVKMVRSKWTVDRANVQCWWDKTFWKLCQKNNPFIYRENSPYVLGKENLTLLTCGTGFFYAWIRCCSLMESKYLKLTSSISCKRSVC